MFKKKLWITVFVLLAMCTSLVIVYASMHSNTLNETNDNPFLDVTDSDWFYSDVRYVNEKGLMSGTDKTVFSPNETMTRAMVVTVLWRLENQPTGNDTTFNDVKSDAYYYNAVAWAAENKIVSGYDENTFGSDDDVTREQLAAIFYRFAEYKGYDISKKADLGKFSDSETISDYAVNALEWAVANGIITGTSEDTILPKGNALRCQVAAILRRFCNIYTADNAKEPENVIRNENNTSGSSKKSNADSNAGGNSSSDNDDKTIEDIDIPFITISEVTASPGEEVHITAKINNNPGILGMTLNVNYDMNNLTLVKAENGQVFEGVLDMTTSNQLFSGARFVWDGIEVQPKDIKNGIFLTMTFNIPGNAVAGKYPITLNYVSGDIVDNNLISVDLAIETGYITIKN